MSGLYTFDVHADNFQTVVIEGSKQAPVLLDFWATWCGPCRVLKPVLEKLAAEYQGKFVLAKLETDSNQALASQFAIRGVPTVKAFMNGVVVDEFSGALPETRVRAFIDKLIPSPAEHLRLAAAAAQGGGDIQGALELLREAAQTDPQNPAVHRDMAALFLDSGDLEGAQAQLGLIPPHLAHAAEIQALVARLDFALKAQALPDAATLNQTLALHPEDIAARLQLANLHVAAQRYEEALAQLMQIVMRDPHYQDDVARKTMLALFNMLGGGELVTRYRKLLASALH